MANGYNYFRVSLVIEVPKEFYCGVCEKYFSSKEKAIEYANKYMAMNSFKYCGRVYEKKYLHIDLSEMWHKDETYFNEDDILETIRLS